MPAAGSGVKPELLAPAGSPVTWAAALEAGADAIYLGLKSFSARAFAANFTRRDLERVVEVSHERGARVFVAFNALLKEEELPEAARALDMLSGIGPDALIIQDLGLLRLIKSWFPHFEVHASTLMAGHNLAGLRALADLGFDRAVLARELSLDEVDRLAEKRPLELEMFIHGALCFSFSGQCLMSGFLGGKGSLRGACTQPCRRVYTSGKRRGYFFSPTDLDATEFMGRIRRMPLAALKIEGRMKGAEYVSRVVRAYRLLLDAPEHDYEGAVAEAQDLIAGSMGRVRSTGFLGSAHPADALAPLQATTSGLYLGRVERAGEAGGRIKLQAPLCVGDRVRVRRKSDQEQKAFRLKVMTRAGEAVDEAVAGQEVEIHSAAPLSPGDLLFKVDTGRGEKEALDSAVLRTMQEGANHQAPDRAPSPGLKKALGALKRTAGKNVGPARKGGRRPGLWYRLARTEDAAGLAPVRPDRIILPVTASNVRRAMALRRRMGPLFEKLIWAPPPLVFDSDSRALGGHIQQLGRMGCRYFMVANLGHLPLVSGPVKGRKGRAVIYADHRLNCLNTQAEAQLADLGLSGLTLSLENDDGNLRAVLERPGPVDRLIYLYGQPPLFVSRFKTKGLKDNLPVESPRQERFRIRYEPEYMMVFAERPVFFAPVLKYRSLAGVAAFIIDLEFDPRPLVTAREVTESVNRKRPIKGASRFNLTRGLY